MRMSILFILVVILACQSQKKNIGETENSTEEAIKEVATESIQRSSEPLATNVQQENGRCNSEVCLQLRNLDTSKQSFEIYMLNSVPVAGFQCDLTGINITGSKGGLLEENGYQTSNSALRILSFSMQAKLIPIGEGVLTTIYYSDPAKEVCMTEIIFAGSGGDKLGNDTPECLQLN